MHKSFSPAPRVRWVYLQQLVYFLPCASDERMLFGNTLINVREDEESKTTAFSGDDGTMTEFPHKGLDGLHVSFTLLDTTRNALQIQKIDHVTTSNHNSFNWQLNGAFGFRSVCYDWRKLAWTTAGECQDSCYIGRQVSSQLLVLLLNNLSNKP